MTKVFNRLNIAAVTQEVFDSWETKKQKEYLDQHPNSKFAKQNGNNGQELPKKQAPKPIHIPTYDDEESFQDYADELGNRLGITFDDYEYYGNDDCEAYFLDGDNRYSMLFGGKMVHILEETEDGDSKFIGNIKDPWKYNSFGEILHDLGE